MHASASSRAGAGGVCTGVVSFARHLILVNTNAAYRQEAMAHAMRDEEQQEQEEAELGAQIQLRAFDPAPAVRADVAAMV